MRHVDSRVLGYLGVSASANSGETQRLALGKHYASPYIESAS